jgi:hypothetical protein
MSPCEGLHASQSGKQGAREEKPGVVPQLPDSCSTVGLRRLRGAPDLGQVPLHMRGAPGVARVSSSSFTQMHS